MPSFPNGGTITEAGLALRAKVEAGAELKLVNCLMGDGVAAQGTDLATLSALVNAKASWSVASVLALGDGVARARTNIKNTGLTTGFYAKECGITADDPDDGEILYAYAAADPGDWIPSDVEAFQQIFDMLIICGNASSISVSIDASAADLTLADFEEHEGRQLDPTDTDAVKNKHLSNAQGKVWQDHITHHANPDSSDEIMKHVTDSDVKAWWDHIESESSHFPSGTSMPFNQASAPTGWTKDTGWENRTVIVGDIYGSGGSDSPVSWSAGVSVADHDPHTHSTPSHTLTEAEMPSHRHSYVDRYLPEGSAIIGSYSNIVSNTSGNYAGSNGFDTDNDLILYIGDNTGASGSGGAHAHGNTGPGGPTTHTVTQNTYTPLYQIMITATKN